MLGYGKGVCQFMTSHLLVSPVLNGSIFGGKILSLSDYFFLPHASFQNNILRGLFERVFVTFWSQGLILMVSAGSDHWIGIH